MLIIASFPDSIIKFRGPLIKEMLARGAIVYIAAPDLQSQSGVKDELLLLGVTPLEIKLSRTGMNPFKDIISLMDLTRLIRGVQPNVMLAYTIKPVIYGLLASKLARVPHRFALITGLGYAFTSVDTNIIRGVIGSLAKFLYGFSLKYASKIFFQNRDDEALFRNLGLVSPDQATVVLNGSGIDLTEYHETELPSGSVSFLMIARLLADKGIREYAEAFVRVVNIYPDVEFHLVGWIDNNPGSIRQDEVDAWRQAGLHFHGRLSDVRPVIQNCSVYVLPSYREGTPRTVLEAMAMGRPIITSDAPGCRETVIDGENGFLVPVKSVDRLVDAMIRFIEEPKLICLMGSKSRQIIEERYDAHLVNAVMLREMCIKP